MMKHKIADIKKHAQMKNKGVLYFSIIALIVLTTACGGSGNKGRIRTDTTTSGVARIVVDECFAPVVQQQVDVFEGKYIDATIIPIYTSEREAYEILKEDSVRLIIGTRKLSDSERQAASDRKQRVLEQRLAVDGIALIVNKSNTDTLITVDVIKKIMTGEIRTWKELDSESKLGAIEVIFDSPNSSTAKYINDSITRRTPFGDHVKAMGDDSDKSGDIIKITPNQQVINYVEQNENALGLVGVNWISNPSDTTGLSFSPRINVMSVSAGDDVGGKPLYYKPYPAFLGMRFYPLSRDIYIIITDSRGGLPSGFVSFAAGEIGQRIIFKSGLFPATMPTRVVNVRPMSSL